MRPRNLALRHEYAAAAEALRAENTTVTARTLSKLLSRKYAAVRKFLRDNPHFAAFIGIVVQRYNSDKEYAEAREKLLSEGVLPTHRAIAHKLGIHRCSVTHFVASRKKVRPQRRTPRSAIPMWMSAVQQGRKLTVKYFDARLCQITLGAVTAAQYVDLWDRGHLFFQMRSLPKPDHLPTQKEVLQFLRRSSNA